MSRNRRLRNSAPWQSKRRRRLSAELLESRLLLTAEMEIYGPVDLSDHYSAVYAEQASSAEAAQTYSSQYSDDYSSQYSDDYSSHYAEDYSSQYADDYSSQYDSSLASDPFGQDASLQQTVVLNGSQSGSISEPGEIDTFSLSLDLGQTLSLTLQTDDPLHALVEVRDPGGTILGSATAPAPGNTLLLQTVPILGSGTYQIRVSGVSGSTGDYVVDTVLNAAMESETWLGTTNDTPLTRRSTLRPANHLTEPR
ncbi:hypothetical protein [Novipirellula artificiosorum]|uniref:Peptidase C-terminal archaeal/bacterial domain-containing protein n=1 Tax=Novipirellula artificiosorum TaxID=2528016 RepID=A0A5C6DQJ3_9BACT|nr:hypothetical protein [Novipirellula artificiosorum]TWU38495.1 hypothetical protein Poly41_29710 [Novipirellula artificiosorum]